METEQQKQDSTVDSTVEWEHKVETCYEKIIKETIVTGKETQVSLDKFPYYLSDKTKSELILSTYENLKWNQLLKTTTRLPSCLTLFLSGPAGSEIYQEMLVKGLANHFDAKSLMYENDAMPRVKRTDGKSNFDISQGKGGRVIYAGSYQNSRGPSCGDRGSIYLMGPEELTEIGIRFDKPIPGGTDLNGLCRAEHGFICSEDELLFEITHGETMDWPSIKLQINALFKVVRCESRNGPIILFIKDLEKWKDDPNVWIALQSELDTLMGSVVVIFSHIQDDKKKGNMEKLLSLLKNKVMDKVTVEPPWGEELNDWKFKLKRDEESLKAKENQRVFREALCWYNLEFDGIEKMCSKGQSLAFSEAFKICYWALSHYQMNNPENRELKTVAISSESFQYGLNKLNKIQNKPQAIQIKQKEIATENKFEKKILQNVIPPGDIGVNFENIGSLENVKESLNESVMLPLRRPELFKGQLTKPCKGILLFGPPGTGKTMLAKAVATEAGANFINISMSTVSSMWFGESEKYIRALFSVASKISPTVIFIDEVDSMLSQRNSEEESSVLRRMKNEFMVNWDGLRTKENERVLILAATNRPFDLDEAVIRRMPRRLLVNLPDAPNRAKIMKAILRKEKMAQDVDLDAIAKMTEGYSGCDLKDLCVAAAYRPIQEILEKEKQEKALAIAERRPLPLVSGSVEIRPLNMSDMEHACQQVRASVSPDSAYMQRLLQWEEQYGGGGSMKKERISYFL
ncbi:hypothetical protein SUGI_0318690 [Cryptomeria japonica]|nr:hypothetical protein SUGI_0318690 [Cryptomeria japonica]